MTSQAAINPETQPVSDLQLEPEKRVPEVNQVLGLKDTRHRPHR